MSDSPKDALLLFGRLLTTALQWLSALAGGAVLLLVPVVLLASQGMLPGLVGENGSRSIAASPMSVAAILAMLGLTLAALFLFFGKLRAIIASVEAGDPFTPENAARLEAMAWLFLGVKVLTVLVAALRVHVVRLIENDATTGRLFDLSIYDLNAVVIVMVLFILARVFRNGMAMRDDLKVTV